MSSIKDELLRRWNECRNDAQRYELLDEINAARDAIRWMALPGERNLCGALSKFDEALNNVVHGRVKPQAHNRHAGYNDYLPMLSGLMGHIVGMLYLRAESHARVTQELRWHRAGMPTLMHEFRVETAMAMGCQPYAIECGTCRAQAFQSCIQTSNEIAR